MFSMFYEIPYQPYERNYCTYYGGTGSQYIKQYLQAFLYSFLIGGTSIREEVI